MFKNSSNIPIELIVKHSMEPLVSIIVPVYNVEKYLCRCLDSIIQQTYKNIEVILVDDGSPDACPEICDAYAQNDKRIRVIHKKNGGQSSARNAALDIMNGEYVVFVDSDDYIHKRCVEIALSEVIKNKSDIVQFRRYKGSHEEFPDFGNSDRPALNYNNREIFWSNKDTVLIWDKLYKASLWENIRMPIGMLNEDDATTWRLYYASKKISVIDAVLYYYYDNPNGTMSSFKKTPNIEYPLKAYHDRIDAFNNIGDITLKRISEWRLLKYIVLSYKTNALLPYQKKVLLTEFRNHVANVLREPKVPFSHKCLFFLFLLYPQISRLAKGKKNPGVITPK